MVALFFIMKFSEKILIRYDQNKRDLPWRETKDPYKIWLSEIIMQQTQIAQGTSYYLKFLESFPTIFDLVKADEQDVLLLWQGLGYYSRARNLHKTAKEIVKQFNGKFPETYQELIKLKGIGDYTAAAISSICFDKPHPAVDGNVMRLISRLFEIKEAVNKAEGKNKIKKIAEHLISKERPGDFNQAVMDFGSQYCKITDPDCMNCIFNTICKAYKKDMVSELPNKDKAKAKTKEYYNYFICINEQKEEIIIKKRVKGIWKNLFEFPNLISSEKLSDLKVINSFLKTFNIKHKMKLSEASSEYKHLLSHKELYIKFYTIKIRSEHDMKTICRDENYISVKIDELTNYPFPVSIKKYIEKVLLSQ